MAVRQDEPPQTAIAAGIYPTLNRIAEMEGESSAFASRLPDAPNRISWCATGLFFLPSFRSPHWVFEPCFH